MSVQHVIVFMNAAAGKPGMDGGTRFLLEAIRFCKERGRTVHAVGPACGFRFLREAAGECLKDVCLVETPAYNLVRSEVGPLEIAWGFFRRALKTRKIARDYVAGLLRDDRDAAIDVLFQDHLPETVPAFHLKRAFPGNIRLYFARHLLVYSLFRGFRDFHSGRVSAPGPKSIYHWLTQAYATRMARRCDVVFSVANAFDREFLIGKGFAPERIVVTPYAPERRVARRVGADQKNDHACYLGRYHPQKGLEDLIQIVQGYRNKTGKDLVIDLMGNLEPLEQKIPADFAGCFRFHGSVYGEDKYRRLEE